LAFTLLAVSPILAQTDINGTWTGTVRFTADSQPGCTAFGTTAPATLIVKQDGFMVQGILRSTSSLQPNGACLTPGGAISIPYSGSISDGSVAFSALTFNGSLFVNGNSLNGALSQSGQRAVLTLTRQSTITPAQSGGGCNLGMTLTCPNGNCTATTVNNGSGTCSGEFIIGLEIVAGGGTLSPMQSNLPLAGQQCFVFPSPMFPGADTPTSACIGAASLGPGSSFSMIATANVNAGGSLANVLAFTAVEDLNTGNELATAYVFNNNVQVPTCTPVASVPSSVQSGVPYNLTWLPVIDPNPSYTIDESTSPDFGSTS